MESGVSVPRDPREGADCRWGCRDRGGLKEVREIHRVSTWVSETECYFCLFLSTPALEAWLFGDRIRIEPGVRGSEKAATSSVRTVSPASYRAAGRPPRNLVAGPRPARGLAIEGATSGDSRKAGAGCARGGWSYGATAAAAVKVWDDPNRLVGHCNDLALRASRLLLGVSVRQPLGPSPLWRPALPRHRPDGQPTLPLAWSRRHTQLASP